MTKILGYARVSTTKQVNEGVSLEHQVQKLKQYAALHDADLVDVIVDAGESAKSLARPGVQRVLEAVRRKQVDSVVIVKLDRLTRSVRDLGVIVDTFTKAGVALVSVQDSLDTGTAAGRLVLNVLGSVAQWEREAIGERTSAAMQHMQAAGQYIGGCAPLGSRLEGGALVDDVDGQTALALMKELSGKGYSVRAIAAELEARGVKNARGVVGWSHVIVARHLRRLAA